MDLNFDLGWALHSQPPGIVFFLSPLTGVFSHFLLNRFLYLDSRKGSQK